MKQQWKIGDKIECDMSFVSQAATDAPDGLIKGIASTATTDLYGHKVMPGAFDDSIKKKGLKGPRGIKLLAGHDWHKIAGAITMLETVNEKLAIEAQLNLNVSYVRDLYEVTKQNGGLNFSVGFSLQEYEFVDDEEELEEQKEAEDPAWLIIKKGDLMEVSVVAFPAQLEAEMTFVKQGPPNSLAEFEKALIAEGFCKSRAEAKKLTLAVKQSSHLFATKPAPAAPPVVIPQHSWPDASKLKAAADLAVKVKAMLGSR